jgi:hypothetical protein
VFGVCAFPSEQKAVVRTEFGISIVDLFAGETVRSFNVLPGLPYLDVASSGRSFLVGEGRGVAVYSIDGEKLGFYSMPGDRVLTAIYHPHEGSIVAGLESGGIVPFAVR